MNIVEIGTTIQVPDNMRAHNYPDGGYSVYPFNPAFNENKLMGSYICPHSILCKSQHSREQDCADCARESMGI